MDYSCIICHIVAPVDQGKPVDDSEFPSWICKDKYACADRLLSQTEVGKQVATA